MNRSGHEPLHSQVAAALRGEIRDHRLPPGSALPSEAALTARFGVARSVVRQAMGTLVAEGLVVRGRGRGSVVAPAREHHRLVQRSSGLFAQMAAEGLDVSTRVLALRTEDTPEVASWLGTAQVLRLERLRSVDLRPLAYIRTYLPLPGCAALTAELLTDASLHGVLQRTSDLRASTGRRQVRAVAADAELAALLEVRAGEPLLLLEGSGRDQHGAPLEVFATWHRADLMAFDVNVDADVGAEDTGPRPPSDPRRGDLRAAAAAARDLADVLGRLARD